MEELDKPKVSITTIVISAVLAAVVFGGGIYAYQSNKAKKDQEALKSQITALETDKTALEKQVADSTSSTTITQSNNSATTPTPAKLTTYTNSLGNFSFDVPDGYIVFRTGGCEGLCTDKLTVAQKKDDLSYLDTFVTVEVTDYGKSQTLEEWNTSTKYSPNKELGTVKIADINAKKYDNGGLFGVTDWRFTKGNFTYIISISEQFSDKNVQNTIANKIVDTLKFTK